MRLRKPTDFLILEALYTHGRNVAPNLTRLTGKSRKNINSRLPILADYGVVRKVGPADRSGLYEITDKGERVLKYRDIYDEAEDFERLIESGPGEGESEPQAPLLRGGSEDESDVT